MKKTVQEVTKEMLDNMEWKERQNGDKIVVNKTEIEWQKNIIHNAHGDKLPDDYCYEFIYEALCTLSDSEEGNEEESIYEIEADVYTSDLTDWLNNNNNNVYYLDEVIKEYGNNQQNGFNALMIAQYKAIEELYNNALYLLIEDLKENFEEEEI